MELNKYERETIILYNEAEPTASVNTYNQALMNKLREYNKRSPVDYVITKDTEQYIECTVPKRMIQVKYPRTVSEEERERMSERMKTMRRGDKRNNEN